MMASATLILVVSSSLVNSFNSASRLSTNSRRDLEATSFSTSAIELAFVFIVVWISDDTNDDDVAPIKPDLNSWRGGVSHIPFVNLESNVFSVIATKSLTESEMSPESTTSSLREDSPTASLYCGCGSGCCCWGELKDISMSSSPQPSSVVSTII